MPSIEETRARQVAQNRALLASLGVSRPVAPAVVPSTPKPKAKPAAPRKRQLLTPPDSSSSPGQADGASSGRRTSARIKLLAEAPPKRTVSLASLTPNYVSDDEEGEELADGSIRKPARLSGHRPNPKVFGHQRGVAVGTWWSSRMEASQAGIHAPCVAGIAGSESLGAWSIALSGGYADDIDSGYSFTYTGCGGRDLKGTKDKPKNLRTAPQTFDQDWAGLNGALRRSSETGKPIRVIRGFKGSSKSPFAPVTGYRYDGLYVVKKAWMDVGESGFLVTRFALTRLDGQPDIPITEGREEEAKAIIAVSCGDGFAYRD